MQPLKKIIKEETELDYFKRHLKVVNALMPESKYMTKREIDVLAAFMSIKGELAEPRFSTLSRKKVKQRLNMKDSNLSNQLRSLKRKEMIRVKSDNSLEIWDILFANPNKQGYLLKVEYEVPQEQGV